MWQRSISSLFPYTTLFRSDFSVVVSYKDIAAKNYSLSAGQYFDVKIEYVDITPQEFSERMKDFSENLDKLFKQRSEEHTSELQSPCNLVCRLLLEKKKEKK